MEKVKEPRFFGRMKPKMPKIFSILFIGTGIAILILHFIINTDEFSTWTLLWGLGGSMILIGIDFLLVSMRKQLDNKRQTFWRNFGILHCILAVLCLILGSLEILLNFWFYDIHFQPIFAYTIAFITTGLSLLGIISGAAFVLTSFKLINKAQLKTRFPRILYINNRIGGAIITVSIIIAGIGLIHTPIMCNFRTVSFLPHAYELPTGSHYNPQLDTINVNQTVLETLEYALWQMTQLQHGGGFPMYAEGDGSKIYGDRGQGCPYQPGEFSMQGSTPYIALIYLRMYQLEPNPAYLAVARTAADALLKIQDETNGGFYYDGLINDDGTAAQPHPFNYRKAAILDDNTMQSCMEFLMEFYAETHEEKYLKAIERGFDCIAAMETPIGGWRQRSNFPDTYYPSYATLNDGCLADVARIYLQAYDLFGDEKYWEAVQRAGDFLRDVQGNGGSDLQQGWAQQYSWDGMPASARPFEPKAIGSMPTVSALWVLVELFLRTGDVKWVTPMGPAIEWLQHESTLIAPATESEPAKYSRLYELQTNVPIYGIKNGGDTRNPPYTYSLEEARPGYSWISNFGVTGIIDWYSFMDSEHFNLTTIKAAFRQPPGLESLTQMSIPIIKSLSMNGFWLNEQGRIQDNLFYTHCQALIALLALQAA